MRRRDARKQAKNFSRLDELQVRAIKTDTPGQQHPFAHWQRQLLEFNPEGDLAILQSKHLALQIAGRAADTCSAI